MKKIKSFLNGLRSSHNETREDGRDYLAEQLEGRVLYSGTVAPDASVDDQVVQEAPADNEPEAVGADGSPVSAIEAAQQASAEMEQFVSEGIELAGGETDIPADQDVVILNPEAFGDLGTNGGLGALSQEAAQGALDAAAERWSVSGVLTDDQGEALGKFSVQVADLEGDLLLVVSEDNSTILLDIDAAGREWFVDGTPLDDSEFTDRVSLNGFRAESGTATEGVDVLTILMEAQGALLGVDGVSAGRDVSATGLEEGLRRIPIADEALTNPDEVTTSLVADLAQSAAQRWEDSGLSAKQLEALANIEYRVVDLSSGILGSAEGNVISIDIDAAGIGWFVDLSPEENGEFLALGPDSALFATHPDAQGRFDLLTAILHEQGHVMGISGHHDGAPSLMAEALSPGDRFLPSTGAAEGAVPGTLSSAHLGATTTTRLDFPISLPTSASGGSGIIQGEVRLEFSPQIVSETAQLSLTSPQGTSVIFFDGPKGIVNGPFSLDAFDGEDASGTWWIEISGSARFTSNPSLFITTTTEAPANQAPTDINLTNDSIAENSPDGSVVGTLGAVDADDGDTHTFTLGGADQDAFTIDGNQLKLATSPDFEGKSSYDISVTATDAGGLAFTKEFTVQVTDENEAPVITSNGGGNSAAITLAENTVIVTTVTAEDRDDNSSKPVFSIDTTSADAHLFTIDSATGILSFIEAPDFEKAKDADGDNVYEVRVIASEPQAGKVAPKEQTHQKKAEKPVTEPAPAEQQSPATAQQEAQEAQQVPNPATKTLSDSQLITVTITDAFPGLEVGVDGKLAIGGGSGNDNFTITRDGSDIVVTNNDTGGSERFDGASITAGIVINGTGGDDTFTVDFSQGAISGPITVNGGDQVTATGDVLTVIGIDGDVVYTPDEDIFGDGVIDVEGTTINFTGLEPVDFDFAGPGTFTLTLSGDDDIVDIANGTLVGSGDDALVISGSSGGVNFETAHVRNADAIVINTTTGIDGDDTITITSADNAHGNDALTIITGTGSDAVDVDGAIDFDGNITITTIDIDIASGADITSTSGDISLTGLATGNSPGIVSDGADIITGGAGTITINASGGTTNNGNALLISDGTIQTDTGAIEITGQVINPASGPSDGVALTDVTVTTNSSVTITGTGGNRNEQSDGVQMTGTSSISAGDFISLTGSSGEGGLNLSLAAGGTGITTTSGDITISGTRLDASSGPGRNIVTIQNAIIDTGVGAVTITGVGSVPTGGQTGVFITGESRIGATTGVTITGDNGGTTSGSGVRYSVSGAGNGIQTDDGDITITGAGSGGNGVVLENTTDALDIVTNGMNGTVTISGTGGSGSLQHAVLINSTGVASHAGAGSIEAGTGGISITGQVFDPDSTAEDGVKLDDMALSTTGFASVSGILGANRNQSSSGLEVVGFSSISAGTGITLFGASNEAGITFDPTAGGVGIITTTGDISITGETLATATPGSGRSLVRLDDTRVETGGGSISITGTANHVSPGGGGIIITGASDLDATGNITIDLDNAIGGGFVFDVIGAGNEITSSAGGNISVDVDSNTEAIRINSDQASMAISTTGSGTIFITGTGGIESGFQQDGIDINNADITTDTGDITLTGSVRDTTVQTVDGVRLDNVDVSTDGSIAITGTGGTRNGAGNGVDLRGTTTVTSTGAGDVTVAGDAPNSLQPDLFIANTATVSSASGVVTLTGDAISLHNNTPVATATANDLRIQPFNTGTSVGVGSGAGDLVVDSTFIGKLSVSAAHTLIIGRDDSTATTTVDSFDTSAESYDLHITGDNVDLTSLDAGANDVTITALTGEINDNAGTDITAANVTLNGTVNPGQSPGILEITGDTTINDELTIELEGTTGGPGGDPNGYDQVQVTGNVTLDAASTLNVDLSSLDTNEIALGDEFTIVDVVNGGDSVTGEFSNAGDQSIVSTNIGGTNIDLLVRYGRGDGNDITLTAVNVTTRIFDDGNDLIIEDIDDDTDDQLTVTVSGGNLVISDTSGDVVIDAQGAFDGATGDLTDEVTISLGAFTGNVIFRTGAGDDVVNVDDLDTTTGQGLIIEDSVGTDTVNFQGGSTNFDQSTIEVNADVINVNAGISTNNSNVTFNADDTITQGVGTAIETGTGGIDFTAVNDITITEIGAFGGTINLTSTSGAILDGDGADTDVSSLNFAASAAGGVGTSGNAIDLAVTNFEADGGTGGIFADNVSSMIIGGVTGALSGLQTTNADIVITSLGNINVTSEGVSSTGGDITLTANSDNIGSGQAFISRAITAAGGDIALSGSHQAEDGVVVLNNITTTGAGRIDITGSSTGTDNGDYGVAIITPYEVSTVNGDITINGASAASEGIVITGSVKSTGSGNISLTGTGGNGGGDYGVAVRTAGSEVTASGGDITITGTSGGDEGVFLNLSTVTTTGVGNITLDGTSTGGGGFNAGVAVFQTGTIVRTQNGDIDIDGTSAGDDGVQIYQSVVESTGTGSINIDGTGGAGAGDYGVSIFGSAVTSVRTVSGSIDITGSSSGEVDILSGSGATITSTSGDISLVADDITIGGNISSSGELTIAPRTASTTIGIGGGAGSLNLDDTELAFLTDGFSSITIGDLAAGTGAVDVDSSTFTDDVTIVGGSIDVTDLNAGTNDATLIARTGAITDGGDAGTDVTATNVTLDAAGNIGSSTLGDEITLDAASITTITASASTMQYLSEADMIDINGLDAGTGTVTLVVGGEFDLTTDAIDDATSVVVEDGATFDVNGASDTFDTITLNEGGTLKGDGTLDANVIGNNKGDTTPGDGTPGLINTGDLTLNEGTLFNVRINGVGAAGTTYDQLNVTGLVTLNNPTLLLAELPATYTPSNGDTFTIIENDGSGDPVAGTTGIFDGLLEGSYISTPSAVLPDQLFQITYIGDDGNDIILTATAETVTSNVSIDGAGNLVVEDILGATDTDDNLSITRSGGNYIIEDLDNNNLGTLIVGATQTDLNRIIVPEALVTGGVIVNTLAGDDIITIGDLGTLNGDLTVDGGDGTDSIFQSGDVTLSIDLDGSYTAETITFTSDADVAASGTGALTLNAGRNIAIHEDASLTTVNGDITMEANVAGNSTGLFTGIRIGRNEGGANLTVTGTGSINLEGQGGDFARYNDGILITKSTLSVNDGDLNIIGRTSAGSGANNQGVSTALSTLRSTGDGDINITGISLSTGRTNGGVDLVKTDIETSGGSVFLNGTGSIFGTRFGFGVQVSGVDITTNGGAIEITGTGNGIGKSNFGVTLSGNTNLTGGVIMIDGTGSMTGSSNSVGVSFAKYTDVTASGALTVTGVGGLGSRTLGVSVVKTNLSGASVSITGTSNSTTGKFNHGISVNRSNLTSGSTLSLIGIGGSGSKSNHGVYVAGGRLSASGLMTLFGTANANTTGSVNAGVYMTKVNIGGLMGGTDITGIGGGLGSGLGDSNHGIFMHKLIGSITGPTSFDGTAGFGVRSEDEAGNYFPVL